MASNVFISSRKCIVLDRPMKQPIDLHGFQILLIFTTCKTKTLRSRRNILVSIDSICCALQHGLCISQFASLIFALSAQEFKYKNMLRSNAYVLCTVLVPRVNHVCKSFWTQLYACLMFTL